jgi:uncharacterized alkaline shock family protein YloU
MADTQTTAPVGGGSATGALERQGGTELATDKGRTAIADSVVTKIAGIAAREIAGVHDMGTGASRTFGMLKEKLPIGGSGPSPTQGVKVEVGERQAAIDIDIIVEYGVAIADVAQAVRKNVINRVERMTGLEVTEVNIAVDDIWLGDDESEPAAPRVQ